MYRSTIFTLLSVVFLSVPVTPTPVHQSLDRRVTHTGRGTWFDDGLGACGDYNVDTDPIIALSPAIYNSGEYCGRWISVTNTANGLQAYGLVHDKCPGCGDYDLDMSPGLFDQIGDPNTGVLNIAWNFEATGFDP